MDTRICPACGFENSSLSAKCERCGAALVGIGGDVSTEVGIHKGSHLLKSRYKKIKVSYRARKSIVYLALDTQTGENVAIKEMPDKFLNDESRQVGTDRFNSQCQMLMGLEHRGLPKILDYFYEGDKYYEVKNFVEGQNLKEFFKNMGGKSLPQDLIVDFTRQILEILDYLHGRVPPYYYRGLKPSNIMVDDKNNIYLIDYDIDRIFAHEVRKLRGNEDIFEAPERRNGKGDDARSDIYSLGMVIRYLYSGIDPEDGGRYSHFKRIRDINESVWGWLDDLVLDMVDPMPENRPPSAKSVLGKIEEHYLKDEYQAAPVERKSDRSASAGPAGSVGLVVPGLPGGGGAVSSSSSKGPKAGIVAGKVPDKTASTLLGCFGFLMVVLILGVVLFFMFGNDLMAKNSENMGMEAFNNKDYSAAVKHFKDSAERKPEASVYMKLAESYLGAGNYQESLDSFKQAIDMDKSLEGVTAAKRASAWLKLAEKHSIGGNYQDAEICCEEAKKINPEDPYFKDFQMVIDKADKQMESQNYGSAVFYYNLAVKIDPKNVKSLLGRARAYRFMSKPEASAEDFKQALRMDANLLNTMDAQEKKSFVNSVLFVAGKAQEANKFDEAIENYTLAFKLDPNDSTPIYKRANIYYEKRDLKKALEDYKKVKSMGGGKYLSMATYRIEQIEGVGSKPSISTSPESPQKGVFPQKSVNAPKAGTLKFYVLGGSSYSGVLVRQQGGSVLLLKGDTYLNKNEWYDGSKTEDYITIRKTYYNSEKSYDFTYQPVKTASVVLISKAGGGSERQGKYYGKFRATVKMSDGTSVFIEGYSLDRDFTQGEKFMAVVDGDKLDVFKPDNNYYKRSYDIKGTGGGSIF